MKRALSMLALGAALAQGACKVDDETDLKPPAGYVPPTFHPLRGPVPPGTIVRYGEGFSGIESSPAGTTWRWTSRRGTVHLPNDRTDKQLRIVGSVPLELLGQVPTIRILLEGEELDCFAATGGNFARHYAVARARLGGAPSAELTIETSATFHAPGDPRELGVSISILDWRDGPGATSAKTPVGPTAVSYPVTVTKQILDK